MFSSKVPILKVSRLWSVKLASTEAALNLAAELMTKADYPPNKRERGIAQWININKEKPNHNCFIWFRGYRGLHFNGYIGVDACDCKKPQPLQGIVEDFEKEMRRHELFATLEEQLFNSIGSS